MYFRDSMNGEICVIVSAHPDDMEVGMGGTAAKLIESGMKVISIVLTDGRRGPNPFQLSPDQLASLRQEEARQAAAFLGVSEIHFAGFPNLVDSENYNGALKLLQEWINQFQPIEIFTLHPQLDRHLSHRLAGKLTLESAASLPVNIWAYEVWGLFATWDRSEDISLQIEKKKQAIERHRSQVLAVPFSEGVIGLNRWRAVFGNPNRQQVSETYVEVFVKLQQHE